MALPSLTLRTVKGSALTFTEMDTNLQNLANAVVQVTAGGVTSNINLNSGFTVSNSATVGATIAGNVLTLTSTGGGGSGITSVTAGGTVSTGLTSLTFANTATVGVSITGNTVSLTSLVTGGSQTPFTSNIDGNGFNLNNVVLNTYRENTANIGTITGTVTLDANTAPVQTAAVSGNITINTNNLNNFLAGESVTLILRHTGNTRTFTSNLKFVNGNKTIGGTTNVTDIVTIFYDGTEYLAAVAKYQA
jgi:hypothetical protein